MCIGLQSVLCRSAGKAHIYAYSESPFTALAVQGKSIWHTRQTRHPVYSARGRLIQKDSSQ